MMIACSKTVEKLWRERGKIQAAPGLKLGLMEDCKESGFVVYIFRQLIVGLLAIDNQV